MFLISLPWIKGNARGSARLASRSLFARARVNIGGEYAFRFAPSLEKSVSPLPTDRASLTSPSLRSFSSFFLFPDSKRTVRNRGRKIEALYN